MSFQLDHNILLNQKSLGDYMNEAEDQQFKREIAKNKLARLMSGEDSSLPAAVQIANEIQKARQAGDKQRLGDLMMASKMLKLDSGITLGEDGSADFVPNYEGLLTRGEYAKQTGQNQSDLDYNPDIAGGEAEARQQQELNYAAAIEKARRDAAEDAEAEARQREKARKWGDINKTLELAEPLVDAAGAKGVFNPSGGGLVGNVKLYAKRMAGVSDEQTKATKLLQSYGGWLVSNVPRMEGPQSNFDVQNYQIMAADLADPTTSPEDKKAAIVGLRELGKKYNISIPSIDEMENIANRDIPQMGEMPMTPDLENTLNRALGLSGGKNPMQSQIPNGAIEMLRNNPQLAPQFDQKYGAGASRRVLGQ